MVFVDLAIITSRVLRWMRIDVVIIIADASTIRVDISIVCVESGVAHSKLNCNP